MDMGNSQPDAASSMYFSPWSVFETHLLFIGWDIRQPWQFALSWFAVAFAAIVYVQLDCLIRCFEKAMLKFLSNPNVYVAVSDMPSTPSSAQPTARPTGWAVVKLLYATLSAVKYGLSLMLMLVAMSFIPSLFLALVVGYLIGTYCICDTDIDMNMNVGKDLWANGGVMGTVFRTCLCLGSHEQLLLQQSQPADLSPGCDNTTLENVCKYTFWIMPRLCSLVFLVILLVWIVEVEGSFGYVEESVFGWHALLMSFFIAMFTNEAILTYSVPLFPQLCNNRNYLR
jgi:Ctr copper transporter family